MISNSEIETKIETRLGKWLMIPRFASNPFSYTQIAIGEDRVCLYWSCATLNLIPSTCLATWFTILGSYANSKCAGYLSILSWPSQTTRTQHIATPQRDEVFCRYVPKGLPATPAGPFATHISNQRSARRWSPYANECRKLPARPQLQRHS